MRKREAPELAQVFQALGDRTRLRLMHLMGGREICVCYLVEVLGEPQPKISRHLAYLRRAGLVAARREGKWMHYRLATPEHAGVDGIVRQTLRALEQEKAMQADRARLERVCCAPQLVALEGAPVPGKPVLRS